MITNQTHTKLFPLSQIVATPLCLHVISEAVQHPVDFLRRHLAGDWGDLSDEDKRLNDEAVKDESRILSAYKTTRGDRVWLISEADRSATTILLPSEY